MSRLDAQIEEYVASLPPERREKTRQSLNAPDIRCILERIEGMSDEEQKSVAAELERMIAGTERRS